MALAAPPRRGFASEHSRWPSLEEYAAPSLLVDADHDIIHVSGRAGAYLRIAGGSPSQNLWDVIHPDLRADLRSAFSQAEHHGMPVQAAGIVIDREREGSVITATVRPVRSGTHLLPRAVRTHEELQTVNQELKLKIEEQTRFNDDLQNLVHSTEIGTIFLGRALNIKLFTPAVRALFNLIPADRGRPLSDITTVLDHPGLVAGVSLKLEALRDVAGVASGATAIVEEARAIIARLDKELAFFTWELRPAALDDFGLAAALGTFVNEWSRTFGVAAEFHTTGLDDVRLSFDVETNLYRIERRAPAG